ncbi:MAG: hypothetical protein RIQ47_69 [Bacteroidota bacterium]|jgi:hypothetical protein
MYNVTVQNKVIKVEMDAAGATVDGQPFGGDLLEYKNGCFHILRNNRSYTAEILQYNSEEKSFVIKVNNAVYSLSVRDKYDELLREMGIDIAAGNKVNDLKAPMPGLVLNVLVTDGQPVSKGDSILVLEAMKMENIIKAPADGTVKKVAVAKGDKVEKNQVMITMG